MLKGAPGLGGDDLAADGHGHGGGTGHGGRGAHPANGAPGVHQLGGREHRLPDGQGARQPRGGQGYLMRLIVRRRGALQRAGRAALITSISCTDHLTAHALITWMIIH